MLKVCCLVCATRDGYSVNSRLQQTLSIIIKSQSLLLVIILDSLSSKHHYFVSVITPFAKWHWKTYRSVMSKSILRINIEYMIKYDILRIGEWKKTNERWRHGWHAGDDKLQMNCGRERLRRKIAYGGKPGSFWSNENCAASVKCYIRHPSDSDKELFSLFVRWQKQHFSTRQFVAGAEDVLCWE